MYSSSLKFRQLCLVHGDQGVNSSGDPRQCIGPAPEVALPTSHTCYKPYFLLLSGPALCHQLGLFGYSIPKYLDYHLEGFRRLYSDQVGAPGFRTWGKVKSGISWVFILSSFYIEGEERICMIWVEVWKWRNSFGKTTYRVFFFTGTPLKSSTYKKVNLG